MISYVAQGITNKEIAQNMQCSVSKIEKCISAMFKKANVSNRADLVGWWESNGSTSATQSENLLSKTKGNTIETIEDIPPADKTSSLLTSDEKIVMDFLAKGFTTDEIATKTQSTEKKIAKQLKGILGKSGVGNRTELIRWWKEEGSREENQ